MNETRKELQQRLAKADELFRTMEETLAKTKKLIGETREILKRAVDAAPDGGKHDKPKPGGK